MAQQIKIALDLDGTISEFPEYFKVFTEAMSQAGCKIYILTDRPPGTEDRVAEQLRSYGIKYDVMKITSRKSDYILAKGINVLYDDTDIYFQDLPAEVAVFKIRQKYNFDFTRKKWL